MAFRPKPQSFYWSGRIDYDAVSQQLLALKARCAEAADIPAFIAIIRPVYQTIVASHLHLLDGDDYRPGELASLMAHLEDCVNALLPQHLPYVAVSDEELCFIPKSAISRGES